MDKLCQYHNHMIFVNIQVSLEASSQSSWALDFRKPKVGWTDGGISRETQLSTEWYSKNQGYFELLELMCPLAVNLEADKFA